MRVDNIGAILIESNDKDPVLVTIFQDVGTKRRDRRARLSLYEPLASYYSIRSLLVLVDACLYRLVNYKRTPRAWPASRSPASRDSRPEPRDMFSKGQVARRVQGIRRLSPCRKDYSTAAYGLARPLGGWVRRTWRCIKLEFRARIVQYVRVLSFGSLGVAVQRPMEDRGSVILAFAEPRLSSRRRT